MRTTTLLALAAALAGCAGSTSEEPVLYGGTTQTLDVFAREWVHFGAENKRTVDVTVTLPPANETYNRITGEFRLECPAVSGGCDHWDRYGTFGIVLNPGDEANEQYIELDRFVTAYRTGFGWTADLTAYRPLLTDTVTMRVFIDTWVTEGHTDGAGWLFSAALNYRGGGLPTPNPVAVVPVWGHTSYNAGDPTAVGDQIADQQLDLDAASSWELRSFITGHGFGGADNCAEFCAKDHSFAVDGESHTATIWRDDCATTRTDSAQQGTWQYDRAGWCPGAQVFPWVEPLSTPGGEAIDVSYDLEEWHWPGDGGQPYYYMSAVLVGYE